MVGTAVLSIRDWRVKKDQKLDGSAYNDMQHCVDQYVVGVHRDLVWEPDGSWGGASSSPSALEQVNQRYPQVIPVLSRCLPFNVTTHQYHGVNGLQLEPLKHSHPELRRTNAERCEHADVGGP